MSQIKTIFSICLLVIFVQTTTSLSVQNRNRKARLVGDPAKYRPKETSGQYAGNVVLNFCFPQSGYEAEKAMFLDAADIFVRQSCAAVVMLRGNDNSCSGSTPGVVPVTFGSPWSRTLWSTGIEVQISIDEYKGQEAGLTKNLITNACLHEIGHVLGFGHEHDHSRSTCHFKDPNKRPVDITSYDPESIMNYCNSGAWGDTPKLSQLDISGAQQIYGRGTRC